MEEVKIASKLIESVSYQGRNLYIKFNDGRLVSYNDVSQEVFDGFINADSCDEYYVKMIVPAFSFRRMA